MKYSEYSVVIVGSGAAGLYAALKISEQFNMPDGVLIVSKDSFGHSNSMFAQGGIVGVVHQNPDDSVESHVIDTLKAGAGLSDTEATEIISDASDIVINDLIRSGVDFDRDENGNLTFTLEAAHSVKRILHSGGDATGIGIVQGLLNAVQNDNKISVSAHTMAVEILVSENKECKGVILYNEITGEHEVVYTSALILATGGAGQVYKYTTNPNCATGDGIALAYEAGAEIQDIEFVQFHPTALALSPESESRFLISEAVRGEGAKLLNSKNEEFMSRYSDKKELAPRDVVARAIFSEMQKENSSNVYLNAAVIEKSRLAQRFPTISKICQNNGINIAEKPIPVAPAAHYTMGGVKATVEGKTSIKGLYAIGETASTGFHGANRLASNSLLECVVCAYELSDYLSFTSLETPKRIDNGIKKMIDVYSHNVNDLGYNIQELKTHLKNIMWDKVGIVRSEEQMVDAKNEIDAMIKNFKRRRKCLNRDEYEYRNMLTVASLIVKGAIARKESRGAHYRKDYTQTDAVGTHSVIIKETEKRSN